jgi:SPP1 gp7 family putative phage head morphogenesis protein
LPIDVTDDPDRYDEAIRAFRKRVPMPDWQWDALTEAERTFAFKVSGVAQADLVTDAWEAIDRALRDGTTLEDFKAEVGAKLEAAWGREDPARLENIFRTNTHSAYTAGQHAVVSNPEVRKARPYWRFDTSDDPRVCDTCDPFDGLVLPADDPFWITHIPPLHGQCRCPHPAPLSPEEADDEGIADEVPDGEPQEGFGRAPSGVGSDWEPDTSAYPGPIRDVLRDRLP